MIFKFCILLAFLASINGEMLHEYMTKREIKSIFHEDPESLHKVDYDVVQLSYDRERRSLRLSHTTKLNSHELQLEFRQNVLVGKDTLFFRAQKKGIKPNGDPDMVFIGTPMREPSQLTLFHDLENEAALVMHQSSDGRYNFDGSIKHNIAIRSVTPQLHNLINKNTSKFYGSQLLSSEGEHVSHHIIIKERSKEEVGKCIYYDASDPTFYEQQCKEHHIYEDHTPKFEPNPNRASNPAPHKTPTVTYLQMLIAYDYESYERKHKNINYMQTYLVAFWNAVDLRFRSFRHPYIRLNIAGVVVPANKESSIYLENPRYNNATHMRTDCTMSTLAEFFLPKNWPGAPEYDFVVGVTPRQMFHYAIDCVQTIEGLAPVRGACKVYKDFSLARTIVKDDGIFSGVLTAAHEIGHLLGAWHDGEQTAKPCLHPTMGRIMHTTGGHDEWSVKWSTCSDHDIKEFIKSRDAACLYNKPVVNDLLMKILPGSILKSWDEHCSTKFGKEWKASGGYPDRPCAKLFCKAENSEFVRIGGLPLDGSICGPNMMCQDAECRPIGYQDQNFLNNLS